MAEYDVTVRVTQVVTAEASTPERAVELALKELNEVQQLGWEIIDIEPRVQPIVLDNDAIDRDIAMKVAAVARRLYSQDRMTGDQMRNAAQLLDAALGQMGVDVPLSTPHATYDARLEGR